MTRALIFDLDGTLTESKAPLTPEMGQLLAKLVEKLPVAVMSGASYDQFQMQLLGNMPSATNFSNVYLFPTSAGTCYVWRNGGWQQVYTHAFTDAERIRVLAALSGALDETNLRQPSEEMWGEQIQDRDAQITWSALGQFAPAEIKKTWDPDRSKREPLRAALEKRLPGYSIRVNAYTSIDITRAGIDKAFGIQEFSKLISIPIADMLYVGDGIFPGGNDEVVLSTGVPTHAVSGPAETAVLIQGFL